MTKDRMLHSYKVAQVMQVLAEMAYMSAWEGAKAFALGLNHDIGYCSSEAHSLNHQKIGENIMMIGWGASDLANVIGQHGRVDTNYMGINNGLLLYLLDIADNSVTGNGALASYAERLKDISKRCPPEAIAYTKAVHENMRKFGENCANTYPQITKLWHLFDSGALKAILEQKLGV